MMNPPLKRRRGRRPVAWAAWILAPINSIGGALVISAVCYVLIA